MPSTYAHYRFGFRALPRLEPHATICIRRNRQMYDLGLHGPDFFFFYNPVVSNKIGKLGSQIHQSTGRSFFTRAARLLRFEPSEAAESYILGVLAHFTLDSRCHPFVNEMAGKAAGHVEMEAEFDRYLLELDGRREPHTQKIFRHIRLDSREDAARIARFYPPATAGQVRTAIGNMSLFGNLLTTKSKVVRSIIGGGYLGNSINENLMMATANPRCKELTPQIMARYTQAEEAFPSMVTQFLDHLHHGCRLGEEFDVIFG